MDKTDQRDIRERNKALESACATLMCNIRELGEGAIPNGLIPSAPRLLGGADLQYNHDLETYHASLAGLLAGRHLSNNLKAAPSATSTAAQAPSLAISPSAPSTSAVASAALTADETKLLTWTERVQYAGGKVTADQLRANITARQQKGPGAIKTKTSLEKVLEARGAKTLAELKPQNLD